MEEVLDQISGLLADYGASVGVFLAVILEILARIYKSNKVQSIPRMVGRIARGIANILEGLAKIIDKAVPDRAPDK